MLRVIAGDAKGRRLTAPDLPGVRPTSERVREAMFDILESRGLVSDAIVLDVFSGSGALGIEALSRGAGSVTFVERERLAVLAIEHNLEVTGYAGATGVKVARAEVLSWLSTYGSRSSHGQSYDLALADPPYGFDAWEELLSHFHAAHVLVEHRTPLVGTGSYVVSREYRYGGTLVTLLQATAGVTRESSVAAHPPTPTDPPDPDPSNEPDKDTA
jgi:16S rRNA (guanine966-N2)-methyltransferase